MIFPAIWAILPGPRWVKALTLTIALAAIVFVLFQWVFPWVSVRSDRLAPPARTSDSTKFSPRTFGASNRSTRDGPSGAKYAATTSGVRFSRSQANPASVYAITATFAWPPLSPLRPWAIRESGTVGIRRSPPGA